MNRTKFHSPPTFFFNSISFLRSIYIILLDLVRSRRWFVHPPSILYCELRRISVQTSRSSRGASRTEGKAKFRFLRRRRRVRRRREREIKKGISASSLLVRPSFGGLVKAFFIGNKSGEREKSDLLCIPHDFLQLNPSRPTFLHLFRAKVLLHFYIITSKLIKIIKKGRFFTAFPLFVSHSSFP